MVGPRQALLTAGVRLRQVNWLGARALDEAGAELTVKVRSASEPVAARVRATADGGAEAVFVRAEAGVAPGQACVFYDGDRVLGGGWIAATEAARAA